MGSCMDKKDADSTPLKLGDNEKMDGKLKLAKKKSVFDEDDSDGDMFNNWARTDLNWNLFFWTKYIWEIIETRHLAVYYYNHKSINIKATKNSLYFLHKLLFHSKTTRE